VHISLVLVRWTLRAPQARTRSGAAGDRGRPV